MPEDATPAKAEVYSAYGTLAIASFDVAANTPVVAGELAAGDYELHLIQDRLCLRGLAQAKNKAIPSPLISPRVVLAFELALMSMYYVYVQSDGAPIIERYPHGGMRILGKATTPNCYN